MDINIQQGKPAEWAEILRLTNAGFGRSGKDWFSLNYPHAYPGKAAAKNFTIARAVSDDAILGLINYAPLTIKVGKTCLKAAGIGGVCTLPAARGQGVMSIMLLSGNARERARGVPLGILWGNRVRYRRYGYECAGECFSVTLDAAALPDAATTPRRKLTPADASSVLRLARQDIQSVDRSLAWQRLLLQRKNGVGYTHRNGKMSAYIIVNAGTPENITEAVGDAAMLTNLLHTHLRKHKLDKLHLPLLRHTDFGQRAARSVETWRISSRDAGHVAIYDFGLFLNDMAAELGERCRAFGITKPIRLANTDEKNSFELSPRARGAILVKPAKGRRKADLSLTSPEWVRTFFPPPAGAMLPGAACPKLLAALQFPLEFPNWDHV